MSKFCIECDGTGTIWANSPPPLQRSRRLVACTRCDGTGEVSDRSSFPFIVALAWVPLLIWLLA